MMRVVVGVVLFAGLVLAVLLGLTTGDSGDAPVEIDEVEKVVRDPREEKVMKTREIARIIQSRETTDGAGVRLNRLFGFGDEKRFDPFLLMDAFGSDNPEHYKAGFPWHPHRGIETITYVLAGDVEHGDSLGNKGVIGSGDVQWMTAGSGIIHQEMPLGDDLGLMQGFQLWANLPAEHKMMAPRYRDISAKEIPEVEVNPGVRVKVIAGSIAGVSGPVHDVVIAPGYFDVSLESGRSFTEEIEPEHTAFFYLLEGEAKVADDKVKKGQLALLGPGEIIEIQAESSSRLMLISGRPLGEPIAWRGPIVMNTKEELALAFEQYQNGTFIQAPSPHSDN